MPIITATRVRRAQWRRINTWRDIPGFVSMVWYPVVQQISNLETEPGGPLLFGFIYTIDRIEIIEMMSHTSQIDTDSRIRIDYEANEGGAGQIRRTEIGPLYFMGWGRINGPNQYPTIKLPARDFSLTRIPFTVRTIIAQIPISNFVTDTIIG